MFFIGMVYIFTIQKISPEYGRLQPFLTLALILAKFVFKKCDEILLVQNLGHNYVKKCKISCLVGLNEKQVFTFVHFLYFSNPIALGPRQRRWAHITH